MAKKLPEAKWSDWITREKKRAILSFIGGAVVVACGGAWAAYQYFDKPDVKMEVSYRLCVGPSQKDCPSGTMFVPGYFPMARAVTGSSIVADWVKKECAQYSKRNTVVHNGPAAMCGCMIVDVKCSTQ